MSVDSIAGSNFSSAALAGIAGQRVGDAVGVSVLRKALDIQASSALALLEALPAAPTVSLPSHLGTRIDTTA